MNKLALFLAVVLGAATSFADVSVVAKVNGVSVTSQDLEAAVDALIPKATYHGSVSEEKRDEFREKALENLVIQELQYQDALARGMKPDKKRVKARMEEIRDRFPSKKEYKAALEHQGITEDELRAKVEKNVLAQAVFAETVTGPAQMGEEALKDYYDKNIEKFKRPEAVKLRVISAKDEKKAGEILSRIKAGEDFGGLAARMSEDNYRIKGGDIGYIHKGRIYPELEKAAFAMKAGDISGLIKAEGTWFIIKVEDKKPEQQMSYENVKKKLKAELEAKRAAEIMEKWMAGLRAKAKIEILWKATESR